MHRSLSPLLIPFALALLPLHAAAEPSAQPAPAGKWSLGAGVLFGGLGAPGVDVDGAVGLGQLPTGVGTAATPRLLTPQLSLERRAGERLSFLLGFTGSLSEQNVAPEGRARGAPRQDVLSRAGSFAVSLGLRYAFVEGPATVSGYALVSGGYSALSETGSLVALGVEEPIPYKYQADVFGGGLEMGFAVERRFTEVFAVRISSSLGRIAYSNSYARLELDEDAARSETAVLGSGIQAKVAITPALEARLYF